MRGRLGTGPAKLLSIAAACIALSACDADSGGEPGSVSTLPPAEPIRDVVVTSPKHVDENTKCEEIVLASDVSAATGLDFKLHDSGPFGCVYKWIPTERRAEGLVVINFSGRAKPTQGLPVNITTLFGNTAVEQRDGTFRCYFWIFLDATRSPDEPGAVFWVITEDLPTNIDSCKAAREVVGRGFPRLPDA